MRFLLLLLITALGVRAQYSISSSSFREAAATSSGGQYAVQGNLGKAPAPQLTAGAYEVQGGSLTGVFVVQTPGAPLLSLTSANGNVTVSWPGADSTFVLEKADSLSTGPAAWTEIPPPYQTIGARSQITASARVGMTFYRLRKR